MMDALKKWKSLFLRFAKREPLYVALMIFIAAANLFMMLPGRSVEAEKAMGGGPAAARELAQRKEKIGEAIAGDPDTAAAAMTVTVASALFIFMGILLDFAILTKKKGPAGFIDRTRALPDPRWDIADVIKVLILFFFFGYVMAIIGGTFLPYIPKEEEGIRMASIVNATLMDIIAIAFVFYFTMKRRRHRIADLGLVGRRFFKNVAYGFLGYAAIAPVLFFTLIITGLLLELFNHQPSPQPVFTLFLKEKGGAMLIYLSLFVAVMGPLMEEIFFRGFLYPAVKKKAGIAGAMVITGLIFSFLHAHLVGFLPIMILGIFLAYLYEMTGSLIPSITVHVAHNLIMVAFMFIIKRAGG